MADAASDKHPNEDAGITFSDEELSPVDETFIEQYEAENRGRQRSMFPNLNLALHRNAKADDENDASDREPDLLQLFYRDTLDLEPPYDEFLPWGAQNRYAFHRRKQSTTSSNTSLEDCERLSEMRPRKRRRLIRPQRTPSEERPAENESLVPIYLDQRPQTHQNQSVNWTQICTERVRRPIRTIPDVFEEEKDLPPSFPSAWPAPTSEEERMVAQLRLQWGLDDEDYEADDEEYQTD